MATRSPALSTSAARCRSGARGTTRGTPECRLSWTRGGLGTAGSSCTSFGRMTQVTVRWSRAMRTARSIACRAAAGLVTVVTYSDATSLNRLCRSTSCWKCPPSTEVAL